MNFLLQNLFVCVYVCLCGGGVNQQKLKNSNSVNVQKMSIIFFFFYDAKSNPITFEVNDINTFSVKTSFQKIFVILTTLFSNLYTNC